MTEVLGAVIIRFWAVAGRSCLEIRSCTVFFIIFWFEVGFTRVYRGLQGFTRVLRALQGFTRV